MSAAPTREVLVRSLTWAADGVLTVTLVDPDGGALPGWSPGAHVDLALPNGLERQFSLCGDPADPSYYRLGILREAASRGATQYVHERLRPGDRVRIGRPRNNFALVDADGYLFIAGGIGITPLLPMIRSVAAASRRWQLLYGGRRRAGMAFLDELAEWAGNVTVHPEDEQGKLPLSDWLGDPVPGRAVYCCGPEPLLDAVAERCSLAGWPDEALHVERFHPRLQPERDPDTEAGFDVVCARSGVTVPVPPDTSILHALEAAGVEVVSSCQEGICGTCETAVLEGTPDHRDSLLTASERAAGDVMMVCCSRSLSPRLVLDV